MICSLLFGQWFGTGIWTKVLHWLVLFLLGNFFPFLLWACLYNLLFLVCLRRPLFLHHFLSTVPFLIWGCRLVPFLGSSLSLCYASDFKFLAPHYAFGEEIPTATCTLVCIVFITCLIFLSNICHLTCKVWLSSLTIHFGVPLFFTGNTFIK